jgi:hypothetical protein
MKNHEHSIFRFLIDLIQILILLALLVSPVYFVVSLKIKDLDLKAEITKSVAGVKTNR